MPGAVVLNGGSEFTAESNALNQALVALVPRRPAQVVVVPMGADNPRKAAQQGLRYFRMFGIQAESILFPDAAAANVATLSAAMESADVIYLTDGNPLGAVQILADTEAFAKLRRAWERGAIIAASGAGAMALCDLYWDSGVWEQGLGLIKGIVVIPHYELVAGRFSGDQLRQGLPSAYAILGLDDATGVIITEQQARIYGPEEVTVYHSDQEQLYNDGDSFPLDQPIV
ncbi:MAG: Type 1 glutamine amidotransferase-like domain-containing protein [Anaerolineae bacterium]|nr:Type 1 glutamine amidotransferase-like domain-containing protein [Anaerolineae bacterium]